MANDRRKRTAAVAAVVTLALLAGVIFFRPGRAPVPPPAAAPLPRVERSQVELRDGKLRLAGTAAPFSGVMFEQDEAGHLRSEIPVKDGLVHGLARGWHGNGAREVEEPFLAGRSHGVRTRWFPSGKKRNEATIVDGVLHGPFTEWHENGRMALRMHLVDGVGEGLSEAWHPDGRLKSRVTLRAGQPVETHYFAAGGTAPDQ